MTRFIHGLTAGSLSIGIIATGCSPAVPGAASQALTQVTGGAGDVGQGSMFAAAEPWNKDVSTLQTSDTADGDGGSGIIAFLADKISSKPNHLDFSFNLLAADDRTVQFTPRTADDDYFSAYYTDECDNLTSFPVPRTGAIEGVDAYRCDPQGDCHLLVVDQGQQKLWEMYQADLTGDVLTGTCGIVWDLTKAYPDNLRGDGCTSTDAAGFPVGAMVLTTDEVSAALQGSDISHALRFTIPNSWIRKNTYVHPATHTTGATSGPEAAPPYGVRLRLRPDFPLDTLPSDGARAIARALMKYGMFLADGAGGHYFEISATTDRFTTAKWTDVGVDADALSQIQASDWQVVDMGDVVNYDSHSDCHLNN